MGRRIIIALIAAFLCMQITAAAADAATLRGNVGIEFTEPQEDELDRSPATGDQQPGEYIILMVLSLVFICRTKREQQKGEYES